ncbi:cysteine desulfurase family protein [Arthrobacter sp. Y-9]|uniref:cysteine desulfurase family protein n=1 Tax=Arthrobacter sp. Y-9 TaxID=3039385 RepID=UPI00241CAEE4|nr:cysteine desulfurase family protein [Arthrobacter sp. Y-9]WFR82971.1 cysteine desulfurase family protein [Arthrobacter sp. Y-9]
MIYLDAAATTPVRPEVLQALWPVLSGTFGNPASHHEVGESARAVLEDARRRVAAVLGCRPAEVLFTSGGTEADNAALKGIALARRARDPRLDRVLISAVEHPAVAESAEYLARVHGFTVDVVPVDHRGVILAEEFGALLGERTAVASVMYANNEVGTVQDLPALAALAQAAGVPLHSDAVQAAGALPLDVRGLGVAALSLAGHKLGAPKGNGVLYLKARTPFEALLHGGGQQRDRRSGTEDVAGAVAFATALELAESERRTMDGPAAEDRRDRFIRAVQDAVPGAVLTGDPVNRLPGSASFCFPGVAGETVLLELERRGIVCSSGSACAAGSSEPSAVLTAMGLPADVALTAVRFSLQRETSEEDLAVTARALGDIFSRLGAGTV